jgi:3-hydroxyisobutyrate dehydrogenase-like beta-hydroxyacid dehydrogenase
MAHNLVEAGYSLRVYNRTASKAESLVARGVELVARPADTLTRGGVVVTVLWDDAALESVVASDGFLERLGHGGLHISMGTVLPETAQRLAALHAERGCVYLDAPVFGGSAAAAARGLWLPVAGAAPAKERAQPILKALGGLEIFDFGEGIGSASVVKLAGNFLIISAAQSLAEGLSLVERSGVDPKAVVEMLTATLFSAPIYQSYGKMLTEKTVPFAHSAIPQKDLGLFTRVAERVGSPTSISSQLLEQLSAST